MNEPMASAKSREIFLTNRWWKQATRKGEQYFLARQFKLASRSFHQAVKHSEGLYKTAYQAHYNDLDIASDLDSPLHTMYTNSCYKLAESYYHQSELDLAEHYLEAAFSLMVQEIAKPHHCDQCRRCIEQHYDHAKTTLVEYLRYHQVSEIQIHQRITSITTGFSNFR